MRRALFPGVCTALRAGALAALFAAIFTGCETTSTRDAAARRQAVDAAIALEAPGNYFVGRRFYKEDYKMWGWVREPRKPWSASQLVMLNEQRRLAPDRAGGTLGVDNDYEYHLKGYFSGDKVYEPASNRFYPEFVLLDATLVNKTPPRIFADARSIDPKIRLLTPPE